MICKLVRISALIFIGLCTWSVYGVVQSKPIDEWFDSYGKIDWPEEKLRLDDFEIFLEHNPEMIGYIGFNWSDKADMSEMELRVERARNYLICERKMDKSRIVVINGGKRYRPRTVLQPVLKKYPPPDFK